MSRDESKTCINCPYWQKMEQREGGEAIGQCRSEPPVPASSDSLAITNNFAVTTEDAWCRRHPNLHRKDIP